MGVLTKVLSTLPMLAYTSAPTIAQSAGFEESSHIRASVDSLNGISIPDPRRDIHPYSEKDS